MITTLIDIFLGLILNAKMNDEFEHSLPQMFQLS
jgi:hypothetical protein